MRQLQKCIICGRPTRPHLMIGAHAVGPKCAKRLGLTVANVSLRGSVILATTKAADLLTPDLFGEMGNEEDSQDDRCMA